MFIGAAAIDNRKAEILVNVSASNSGEQNRALIQSALNVGGNISICGYGTIFINNTLIIKSNTRLKLDANTKITCAPNMNKNMLQNSAWGSTAKTISAISTSNPSINGTNAVLVTATCASHGKSVGDYVFVHNVSPDIYNGVWEVYSTPDSNSFTYILAYDVGDTIAAGSGTQSPVIPTSGGYTPALESAGMWVRDANTNIEICGGEWDYNGLNQSTPDTFLKHALYLRRISNLKINNTKFSNVLKYAVAAGNIYSGICENIEFDTYSDGIHWIGSGDNLTTRNIFGKAGDDFVTVGQSDYWFYLDSQYVFGDFGTIRASDIKSRQAFSGFKYYGMAGFTARDITIDNIGGYISGGQGVVLLINDTTSVGAESGGSTIKRCNVSGTWDQNSSKSFLNVGGLITIDELNLPTLVLGLGNTTGTSAGILANGGSIIKNINGNQWRFFASSGSYSNQALGIVTDSTSQILNMDVDSIYAENIAYTLLQGCTTTAEDAHIWHVGSLKTKNCAYGFYGNGRVNLIIGIASRKGYQSVVHFQFNTWSKLVVGKSWGFGSDAAVDVASGKTLQIYASEIGVDIATLTTRIEGKVASTFLNVSSTYGTLQQNNPVMWRPADSKWVQMTDTTKTS